MRRWGLVFALLILAFPVVAQQPTPDPVQEVKQYIASAGNTVGIACYPVDQPQTGFFAHADDSYPLASTIKIMILGVYAQGVASGRFDPTERVPLADLDAYYLPGTDSGAQPAFLAAVQPDEYQTLALSDVVYGMIRFSSNAAADYLHARMTDADFAAFYQLMGVAHTDIPVSLLGLMLAQDNHVTGISDASQPRDIVRASAVELAARYVGDLQWRVDERRYHSSNRLRYLAVSKPLIDTQAVFFERYDNRGTPNDFTKVMAALQRGDTLPATANAIMRAALSWPMQFPNNQAHFFSLGTKGGSLPGILTGVYFAQPKGSDPLVLAVFYHDLPADQYLAWLGSFEQQELEFYVLEQGCAALSLQ